MGKAASETRGGEVRPRRPRARPAGRAPDSALSSPTALPAIFPLGLPSRSRNKSLWRQAWRVQRAQTHSLPSEGFQATTGHALFKKKKKSGRGQVIHWDRWSPQHHPGHLKKECALPSGLPLEEPIVGLAWRPHLDYRSLGPTKSKLWISQVSRSSFTRPYISPVSHTWAGTEMHTQTPVRAGETKEPRYLGGGGGG